MGHNMRFDAQLQQLNQMLNHIRTGIHHAGLNVEQALRLELAAEEALVNIVRHAYPEKSDGYLEIDWEVVQPQAFRITIRDEGSPFNPLEVKPPADLDASIDERKAGGLGIYLIRQLMDEVLYERKESQNVLTLVKRY